MSDALKKGASYVTVGGLCLVLGAMISLRIYAGLPERVTELESRATRNETKFDKHIEETRHGYERIASVERHLADIEKMLIRLEQKLDRAQQNN